jgi:hypothetical protein
MRQRTLAKAEATTCQGGMPPDLSARASEMVCSDRVFDKRVLTGDHRTVICSGRSWLLFANVLRRMVTQTRFVRDAATPPVVSIGRRIRHFDSETSLKILISTDGNRANDSKSDQDFAVVSGGPPLAANRCTCAGWLFCNHRSEAVAAGQGRPKQLPIKANDEYPASGIRRLVAERCKAETVNQRLR